jgi:3-deoxy-D-manno-octulosonate 8-phosphate phosphatase (KDO 8-P phosphatase)
MSSIVERAKDIRLLILDVDGVLTTGILYYTHTGLEYKGFHIHDGLGIKLLQKSGVKVAIISGKNSQPVLRRLKELEIEHCYLGYEDKLLAYEELKQKLQFQDQHIAFIGDDLPDLPLLRRVRLAITVPQAPKIIHDYVHLVTVNKAGKGAVREICELIMDAQGHYQSMLQSYLL